jgi:hypothetical protein
VGTDKQVVADLQQQLLKHHQRGTYCCVWLCRGFPEQQLSAF